MGSDLLTIWKNLLGSLEKVLSKPTYEALAHSAVPSKVSESKLFISVPNAFIQDMLKDKKQLIADHIKTNFVSEEINGVDFIISENLAIDEGPQPTLFESLDTADNKPIEYRSANVPFLNPRYTFTNFVVGHGNRFAHAASLAVAETPAKAYNPLFIYGGVGLGKTHLMQAIGHHVVSNNNRAKVIYVTSETFTNEFINAIRDDKITQFRNRFRSIDVLLIDDVQFLAGKERTHEEFFHTFNTLHETSKQIVLSSDRPPKELHDFEDRLRSRLEWGLTADIQSPDFETRVAILKKKAEAADITIPEEVFHRIASKISTNIRELEGALIRVVAYASLTGGELKIELIDDVLKDIYSTAKEKPLSIDLIKRATAEYYSLKIDDMSAKIRTKEIANARQVAMYLSRELTDYSLPKIGEEFGGRDHTTVMHAYDKIAGAIGSDPSVSEAVKSIKKSLQSYF
ncbi:MAG: chromosomal replication initiator protein DnaA [bacterium]